MTSVFIAGKAESGEAVIWKTAPGFATSLRDSSGSDFSKSLAKTDALKRT